MGQRARVGKVRDWTMSPGREVGNVSGGRGEERDQTMVRGKELGLTGQGTGDKKSEWWGCGWARRFALEDGVWKH